MDVNDQQPLSLATPASGATPDEPAAPAGSAPHALDAFAQTGVRPASASSPTPLANTDPIPFLQPSPSAIQLAESAVYRPGVAIVLALLVGPAVCAIVAVAAISLTHAVPVWLPFALLLWLPALLLAWTSLKSVRLTAESVASGRPLGQWNVLPFDEIQRAEQKGPRLILTASDRRTLTITPLLLYRGAHLRRTLLLRLPLPVLLGDLRAQAQSLTSGDPTGDVSGDVSGVLTVRTRPILPVMACVVGVALLAGAVGALIALAAPGGVALALLLVALAGGVLFAALWSVQTIFIGDKGLIIHVPLLRRERDVIWSQVNQIEYLPGEVALLYHGGRRTRVSIGPGLLNSAQARLMRHLLAHYAAAEVVPATLRPRR